MNDDIRTESYETPAVVEVGSFTDLTRIKNHGNYLDNPELVAWFCVGVCP